MLLQGEKECSYYVKTGLCKFGETCKFHHPQPDSIQLSTPGPAALPAPVPAHTLYPTVQSPSVPSSQQYGLIVARPPLLPSSYIHGPYSPVLIPPGMVPFPGWSHYPVCEFESFPLLVLDFCKIYAFLLVNPPGTGTCQSSSLSKYSTYCWIRPDVWVNTIISFSACLYRTLYTLTFFCWSFKQ